MWLHRCYVNVTMVAMVLTQLKLRREEPISTHLQGWGEKSGRVETLWGQGGALFLIGGGGAQEDLSKKVSME